MTGKLAIVIVACWGGPAAADPRLPAPPPEVVSLGKALAGTAKCTGKALMPDGHGVPLTGSLTTRLDLESSWIRATFTAQLGRSKFAFEQFTTFDPRDKQWHRVMVDSTGGYFTGASPTGPANNAWDFALDGASALGPTQYRDHTDTSDAKAMKLVGERSLDRGKTWAKDYELTCTKTP